jgi:3-hydroxybutyryl-CoA dehydrogenase
MINEAIETLYNKVAGVYEIDTVMKLGMGHPMGPLQLADFIGLDVCLAILNVMYDGFKTLSMPCPLLVNMVRAGKLESNLADFMITAKKKAEIISNNLSSLKNPRAARTKNGICCSCAF